MGVPQLLLLLVLGQAIHTACLLLQSPLAAATTVLSTLLLRPVGKVRWAEPRTPTGGDQLVTTKWVNSDEIQGNERVHSHSGH
jgi:hypothetical protein